MDGWPANCPHMAKTLNGVIFLDIINMINVNRTWALPIHTTDYDHIFQGYSIVGFNWKFYAVIGLSLDCMIVD